jgi:uncharacterized protein
MKPTSQKDIDELAALLDEFARLVEAGDGEAGEAGEAGDDAAAGAPLAGQVDGFLTALVVSTDDVPQDEWMAALLPGVDRHLPPAMAARLVALILARKAAIALELRRGQLAFQPIFEIDDARDETLWDLWIEGFDAAVQLRLAWWQALLDHDDGLIAASIDDMAMLIGMARGDRLDPGEHDQVTAEVPDMISDIAEILYCRLRGLPSLAADEAEADSRAPLEPIRVAQIGRNDPCPCGSGKKYKKCCLP